MKRYIAPQLHCELFHLDGNLADDNIVGGLVTSTCNGASESAASSNLTKGESMWDTDDSGLRAWDIDL